MCNAKSAKTIHALHSWTAESIDAISGDLPSGLQIGNTPNHCRGNPWALVAKKPETGMMIKKM
ncbi:hypothetical protein D3C80_1897760 [compost metagenome]